MGFRENLKAELAYSGMLVKELASQTGLKKHTIDNYLSVRGRMPAADVAVRTAKALGVSVEYLITGYENNENQQFSVYQRWNKIRSLAHNLLFGNQVKSTTDHKLYESTSANDAFSGKISLLKTV